MLETIVALATPPGIGAIGIVRMSGEKAIEIAARFFKGKDLRKARGQSLHVGALLDENGELLDEVVVSIYRAPKSYTGEDLVEISCHGSDFILQKTMELCTGAGARFARAGEFTQRAFLNQKLDLTQAEAVADVIASGSAAAHKAAIHQLRGGFSHELKEMREALINFSALIELELDFSEEDVAFADRKELAALIEKIAFSTHRLIHSFKSGNAVKNGISVAIIGKPNAGKSTLLNSLLQEERAIVSPIAGTTRDSIEELLNIDGMLFRLIDTAGIRESKGDEIEDIGMARAMANAEKADIIIHLVDMTDESEGAADWLYLYRSKIITLLNKQDIWNDYLNERGIVVDMPPHPFISAKKSKDMDKVKSLLVDRVKEDGIDTEGSIVTNIRHLSILQKIAVALEDIKQGMANDIPGDLIALDIRQALHYIGELTGEVQVDRDILGTIFGKFCIGK